MKYFALKGWKIKYESFLYSISGWVDWYDYLGTNKYTFKEAKEAVRKLEPKIKKRKEYDERYKEDPRLPSSPYETYKGKGWVDWPDYLGK
jgi:hypothetical protein